MTKPMNWAGRANCVAQDDWLIQWREFPRLASLFDLKKLFGVSPGAPLLWDQLAQWPDQRFWTL